MAEFPAPQRRFGRRPTRVSEAAAAVARGDGPQASDEVVVGAWNLYDYTALRNGRLPAPGDLGSQNHWIWGEGSPGGRPCTRRMPRDPAAASPELRARVRLAARVPGSARLARRT